MSAVAGLAVALMLITAFLAGFFLGEARQLHRRARRDRALANRLERHRL